MIQHHIWYGSLKHEVQRQNKRKLTSYYHGQDHLWARHPPCPGEFSTTLEPCLSSFPVCLINIFTREAVLLYATTCTSLPTDLNTETCGYWSSHPSLVVNLWLLGQSRPLPASATRMQLSKPRYFPAKNSQHLVNESSEALHATADCQTADNKLMLYTGI